MCDLLGYDPGRRDKSHGHGPWDANESLSERGFNKIQMVAGFDRQAFLDEPNK
jgi:hypothetical protein